MKGNDKASLQKQFIYVRELDKNGEEVTRFYTVADLPDRREIMYNGPMVMRKGVAYRYVTDMTSLILPYRGIIEKGEKWGTYAPVGIYLKESKDGSKWLIKLALPHTKKEYEDHGSDKPFDAMAAVLSGEFNPNDLKDIHIRPAKGDAFILPMNIGDDCMNSIIKLAINLKEAPFEPYGKRMEATAMDHSKGGIEGVNAKNNGKRALYQNLNMSPTKAVMYANVWDLDMCILVKDKEHALHPIYPNGEMLAIFPNCEEFTIDPEKVINCKDLVREQINSTNQQKGISNYQDIESEED